MTLKLAAICAACSAELSEGRSVLHDAGRDAHFCDRRCFADWFVEQTEVLAEEYRRENVDDVSL